MRIVVAGSTGVIGKSLLPRLRVDGRTVVAVTRSEAKAAALAADGYETVVVDAADGEALRKAVTAAAPEIIINQLTNLPRSLLNPRQAGAAAKRTNALRTGAGAALAEAASVTGARLIAQSIAFVLRPGPGVRTEDDPFYDDAPNAHAQVIEAVRRLEEATTSAGGTVLRYGAFYGPGTYFAPGEAYPTMLARRLLPVIGEGGGIWGLVHLDDAVDATIKAIVAPAGIYNVTDDDPVPAGELLPWMAERLGVKPPRRVPRAFFSSGPLTILRYLIDEQPAVSNDRAKEQLGWVPRHPSWRQPLADLLTGASGG